MTVPGAIHIDDLAAPRLPLPLRAINRMGGGIARRRIRLEPTELMAIARRREREEDFGDQGFLEPLGVLCDSLEREADLSAVGRLLVRELLAQLLGNRLRLEALIGRHPEIEQEAIREPIVVLGMPRTGTTLLHTLLSLHPGLRSLPYWESLEPIPKPAEARRANREDPRIGRCRTAVRLIDWAMPHMRAMHEITATSPHEEIQLLAVDFRSVLFEVSYNIPSYAAWYASNDQTPGYRYMRRLLQALQWLRGPRRWVLKSPQHLEQLPALFSAFPDAWAAQTHRDPVEITASMCTMLAYSARLNADAVDPHGVGRRWGKRVQAMLEASIRDRRSVDESRFLDIWFEDLTRDNLGTVARVLRFAGLELDEDLRTTMERHIAENRRWARGRIDYRLEDVGLDREERRAAFAPYHDCFDRHAQRAASSKRHASRDAAARPAGEAA